MTSDSQFLANCEIAPDGSAVILGLIDVDGKAASIRLSLDQFGSLAMTLPELMNKALRSRYHDPSMRFTYPLKFWAIEQSSDADTRMVSLGTTDGFAVCFSMSLDKQRKFGKALVGKSEAADPALMN